MPRGRRVWIVCALVAAFAAVAATVKVREGQAFLDGPNTRRFLELNQNPPRDDHYPLVGGDEAWFAVFFFEASGYVKDDEKLDPDALLTSMKDTDQASNDERKRLGMPPLHTDGWHVVPHYDLNTRRLEWATRLRTDDGQQTVNYTIRILGRCGVMRATLVSSPQTLDRDIKDFKTVLTGYDFVAGEPGAQDHDQAERRGGWRADRRGRPAARGAGRVLRETPGSRRRAHQRGERR